MGMFDEIHCDSALPDDACEAGACFQTKSFPDPCMCRYRITASGRFIDSDGNDLEPSGYITFYAYPKDRAAGDKVSELVEYRAKFSNMVFIETPIFTDDVSELLSEEEYAALQEHLVDQPNSRHQGQSVAKREGSVTENQCGVVAMDKKLFSRLVASMGQMDEMVRGVRAPSREFFVDAAKVKEIRAITGLSQPKFAKLLHVDVGTLRNWEQGRREPTGPAQALMRAIRNNPRAVLKALAS